ncbi:hypothetical protein J2X14_003814 [Pantoea alhagi]|uniref:hypothetical protein n=1 Tax=Mixta sp. BE291 TaxID=3158787 RepID=UPI00285B0912|nr:hypothetical protein [Pantoea alhagi]
MTETTDVLDNLSKLVPLCLVILFWLHHFYIRYSLSRYEEMKKFKNWHDLPRESVIQNKEATLNSIIDSERKKVAYSLAITVIFSLCAVFCLFYIL